MNRTESPTTSMTRRTFLQAAAAGLTVASLPSGFAERAAAQTGDHRSLVCVFLAGGADTFNMYVPLDHAESGQDHATYAATRGDFAVPRGDLLPIGDGSFGLHPALPGLADLATSGEAGLAVVSNVGPLAAPIDKAAYLAGRNVPQSLFAHDAQQKLWQTARSTLTTNRGWGASVEQAVAQTSDTSPAFSIDGANPWQSSAGSAYASLSPSAPVKRLRGYDASLRAWIPSFEGVASVMAASLGAAGASGNLLDQAAARVVQRSIDTTTALESATGSGLDAEIGMDGVGSDSLALQLRVVARLIRNREALGMGRQIFFVRMGGWDTHRNQVALFPQLLGQLDRSLSTFQRSLRTMGVSDSVTTFTATDFGRTLTINGDGTDHGWGGHAFVLGGAVQPGEHGTTPSYSTTNNPDDVGDRDEDFAGRLIPTTSVAQYGATLARWMGLDEGQLDAAFPELGNFERRDLGFL